jgi:hypothetical protein
MMLPEARRKKFRAIEKDARTGGFLPINLPAGSVIVRRTALAETASACGSIRQPRLVAGQREARSPRFDAHSRNVPLKVEAGLDFPDDELAYSTRSNVSIFPGAGAAPAPREFGDIGVT